MKVLFLVVLLSMLTGCGTLTNLVQAGATANDAMAEGAEVTQCRGISIGSWVRKYGYDPERAAAWRVLCRDQLEALP